MTVDINLIDDVLIIDTEETIEIPAVYNLENSLARVSVKGKLFRDEDGFAFDGKAAASVTFNCDRCLEPVLKEISFDIYERFSASDDIDTESERENEVWLVKDNKINIMAFVEPNLFTHMPMKVYCDAECKGLCSFCGKNLNDGPCSCGEEALDPRFQVLRSLFDDKEV